MNPDQKNKASIIQTKHIIAFAMLILFYVILGYLLLGSPLAILMGGGLYLLFLCLSSIIPMYLLGMEEIREDKYAKDNILLVVNITHILLMIGFILFVIFYDKNLGDITPTLGYVVVSISLLVNLICLAKDLKKTWALTALSIHLGMFLVFAAWQYIGLLPVMFGFFYMIIHNIFVVSYGIFRFSNDCLSRKKG